MTRLIIEICPNEPRASACLDTGESYWTDVEIAADMRDCNASGDCKPACEYVREYVRIANIAIGPVLIFSPAKAKVPIYHNGSRARV